MGCLRLAYNKSESSLKVAYRNPENCKNQDSSYYPFGLTMSGICSKALAFGNPENKYRFNDGTELNTDFGISLYETDFRLYDPQIGRFVQIDALADEFDEFTPYVYAGNNPVFLNDPTGLSPECPDCPTGKLAEEKDLEGVVVVGYKKSKPNGVLTMINTRGTLFRSNKNGGYTPIQTRPCEDGCVNPGNINHDHKARERFDNTVVDVVTLGIPVSKTGRIVKWVFALRKAKQVLGLARLAYASKFGINSYKALKALKNTGTQVHHLIEKRFAGLFGGSTDDMLSIVVTKEEHLVFTRAWSERIGYDGWKTSQFTTSTVTKDFVENTAREIYKDYP